MKKSILFALFLVTGVFFLNACDVAENIINPYKGWELTLNMTPKPSGATEVNISSASISLGTVSSIVFETIIKTPLGEIQTIPNVTWTAKVSPGYEVPSQYVTFLLNYNRIEISTGFAQDGDELVISAYWQDLVKTSTITFTNDSQ